MASFLHLKLLFPVPASPRFFAAPFVFNNITASFCRSAGRNTTCCVQVCSSSALPGALELLASIQYVVCLVYKFHNANSYHTTDELSTKIHPGGRGNWPPRRPPPPAGTGRCRSRARSAVQQRGYLGATVTRARAGGCGREYLLRTAGLPHLGGPHFFT